MAQTEDEIKDLIARFYVDSRNIEYLEKIEDMETLNKLDNSIYIKLDVYSYEGFYNSIEKRIKIKNLKKLIPIYLKELKENKDSEKLEKLKFLIKNFKPFEYDDKEKYPSYVKYEKFEITDNLDECINIINKFSNHKIYHV